VLLSISDDQELLRETTAKLLSELAPVEELRKLRDDPNGFTDDYWNRGADLGWTSLLVSDEFGGGSISDFGLLDLALVAYEFGRHAAPGPLAVTNVVAAALSDRGGAVHRDTINSLLAGESIATWCLFEPGTNRYVEDVSLPISVEGDDVVLNGVKRPVESGGRADYMLVTGRSTHGLSQVLVPRGTPGVSIDPMHTVDLTRRFSVVSFNNVRLPRSAMIGDVGDAQADVRTQLHRTVAISSAEAVGTMQTAFDMTVEWAFDRYSFGRPLASYQELKHRFADMKSWLEASHAISDAINMAVATGSADADDLVSAGKAYISQFGSELIQDCVQMHGGIGLTFDHDLHLYLRRHTVYRALYGTPEDHRQRLADQLIAQQEES
jgi:alkylation response protein AidB-like acyl-CoA dehydrogenase